MVTAPDAHSSPRESANPSARWYLRANVGVVRLIRGVVWPARTRLLMVFCVAGLALMAGCGRVGGSPPGTRNFATQRVSPTSPNAVPLSEPPRTSACDLVTRAQVSAIVGVPVSAGQGGRYQLSQGIELPRVYVGACSWSFRSYPTTVLYVQVELTPSASGARTEFAAQMSKMQFSGPPEHISGYGDELATNIDSHQDVTVIVLDGRHVLTVEMNSTSGPAPSAAKRMTASRKVARLTIANL